SSPLPLARSRDFDLAAQLVRNTRSTHQYPPPPPPPPEKSHLLPDQNPPPRLQSSSRENRVVEKPAHPVTRATPTSAPMRPRRLRMITRPVRRAIEHGQPTFPTWRRSSVASSSTYNFAGIHRTLRVIPAWSRAIMSGYWKTSHDLPNSQ